MAWPRAGPGRPRGSVPKAKIEIRDALRKGGPKELAANIRDLALNHPDGYVRIGASKLWAEYAYGKPLNAPDQAAGPIKHVVSWLGDDAAETGPPRLLEGSATVDDASRATVDDARAPRPGTNLVKAPIPRLDD